MFYWSWSPYNALLQKSPFACRLSSFQWQIFLCCIQSNTDIAIKWRKHLPGSRNFYDNLATVYSSFLRIAHGRSVCASRLYAVSVIFLVTWRFNICKLPAFHILIWRTCSFAFPALISFPVNYFSVIIARPKCMLLSADFKFNYISFVDIQVIEFYTSRKYNTKCNVS